MESSSKWPGLINLPIQNFNTEANTMVSDKTAHVEAGKIVFVHYLRVQY